MRPGDAADPFRLDRAAVRGAFDRASAGYDAAAVLQARVRTELIERLSLVQIAPAVVLDLGAGTGQAARELKRAHRRARVVALDLAAGMLREARRQSRLFSRFDRVCGDVFELPLKEASVDLVFSSLMLQWCDDLDAAFAEIRRVLRPGGFFAFSTFGPDTLRELRAAWTAADDSTHVNRFLDMHDVGDALTRCGFVEPVLDVERVELTYPDLRSLVRDLKAIGAHNVTSARPRGLTGHRKWSLVTAAYESFRRAGRLPATFEVVYGAAWGGAGKPAATLIGGEAHIPPQSIGRRVRTE
jgi:malonyl-CoA O-methyltransferase